MDESIFGFRFATYHEIQTLVQNSDFSKYSFIGIQVLASTFIILKLIYAWIKDVSGGNKMNNVLECIGLIVFISLAPYALSGIENAFSFLDDELASFQSYSMPESFRKAFYEVESQQEDGWITAIQNVASLLVIGLLGLVGFIVYAIDSSIYAIFILERLIMIEFYRFVFPLFIAYIGIDGLRSKYWHWVTGFLGLMILPIPYMAIYHITLKLQELLFSINRSSGDNPVLLDDLLMALIVMLSVLGLKYKLLTTVTQKVSKLF